MSSLFTQTAECRINHSVCPHTFDILPEVIRKRTDWEYTYHLRDTGCFLSPTFRNMPYRNSFVPEIDIVFSNDEEYTILHLSGQPSKFVRTFFGFWCVFVSLFLVLGIILLIVSGVEALMTALVPAGMLAFAYFLCKYGTKRTFDSIVKAIQSEYA
jgi:hypothetical protein